HDCGIALMTGLISRAERVFTGARLHLVSAVRRFFRRFPFACVPPQSRFIMSLAASQLPIESQPAFLGVQHSLTGKLWRDRLDTRGAARSLAIAQCHQLPEMLASVLAGR